MVKKPPPPDEVSSGGGEMSDYRTRAKSADFVLLSYQIRKRFSSEL
jgi:hypothetical protein